MRPMPLDATRHARARRVRYAAALDALAVETNPRYQPNRQGQSETYCNLFVADAVVRLGGVLPLYLDGPDGRRQWLVANEIQDWLSSEAAAPHWRVVPADEAQALANVGRPVVATWKNRGGAGHMAMVRPGPEALGAGGPAIAQAGAHSANRTDAATGFGGGPARLAAIVYFAAAWVPAP